MKVSMHLLEQGARTWGLIEEGRLEAPEFLYSSCELFAHCSETKHFVLAGKGFGLVWWLSQASNPMQWV